MENYHLFITDENSLKYHIKYGFVATGTKNNDFNICLWKDAQRLKIGDKVIFYVKKLKRFYGIFEISSEPFFDDSNPLYLSQANPQVKNKNAPVGEPQNVTLNLRYRALIIPFQVYEEGIDEFELLDILPPNTEDILWSILYRKLKGERGNSPLFPREYNKIIEKLAEINNNQVVEGENYTFLEQLITNSENALTYVNDIEFNRNLKTEIINGNYDEHFLHALLLQYVPSPIFGDNILWIGNEVYSGAGMQAIDLMSITQQNMTSSLKIGQI